MSAKLDATALDTYARAYAARLGDSFFAQHEVITGPQLLELSDVPQVNLFVVRALYETWKTEALAFRSPYFDFENEEVKTALQALMNVASQHIAVRREAFEPLLTEATRQTLTLLLEPQDFYETYLRDRPDFVLKTDDLKALLRYVRLHRAVPQALGERLDGQTETYVTSALNWLNEHFADNPTLDDAEPVLAQFATVVPLDRASLYKTPAFWAEEPAAPAMPNVTRSFFDLADEQVPVAPKTSVVQAPPAPVPPAPEPEPVLVAPEPVYATNGYANGHVVAPVAPATLNEQFHTEQPTMNQLLAKDAPNETLADKFQKKPVESIHQSISLNQKFTFINQLFNGDSVAYHIAVDDLEHCRSFSEAKELMNRVYGPKYHWRMNPDEADEFYEIVQRRFQG
jgi:hypothetical protein